MSLNAGRCGSEVLTRPIIFSGDELELNFSASAAGSIRVEIQDVNGAPLPGFALENCVEILGDDLARKVRWESGEKLNSIAGRPVKMRFRLVDADIFAFRFAETGG